MADASLGTAVLRTRLDKSGLSTGLNQAKAETQRFARDSTSAIQGISAAFAAVAASAGVRAYVRFLTSTAQLAQQADASTRLYEKSLGRTNQSLSEGAGLVQRLSDRFGVANTVIQQSATLLLRQGASLDDIERALTAAGASAAAAGFDISTAFDNVATAVATGRSELLETSGIVTNLGPVTQAYAKSVGKTVDELTQQEIIQARVNAIYKETASEIEDVDEILQGLPKAQAEWTRELREAKEGIGSFTKDVLVPIVDTGTAVLRIFNDLPDPVKRAGTAMAGAAIGATALATGIVAIRTALTGLSALGLASFGPAGWIIAGVTAVAGLVAVLAGRPSSLDASIAKVNDALAGNDAKSLTGALDEVIAQVDGPVKTVFQELRGELVETGDTGVEQMQRVARAVALLDELRAAQERVQAAEAQLAVNIGSARAFREGGVALDARGDVMFDVDRELQQIRDRLYAMGEAAVAPFVRFNEELGKFENTAPADVMASVLDPEGVARVIEDARRVVASAMTGTAGMVNEAQSELLEAQSALDAVMARINAPTPSPTPPPPPGGGGTGRPGEVELGPLAFARVNPFGPLFQQYRSFLDDELQREVLRFQRGLTGPRFPQAAGSVFGPVFTQFEEYLTSELDREVLRFQSGLLGPSLRFTPVSGDVLGPLATQYADFLESETERFLVNAWDLVSQPARRNAADRAAFNATQNARVGGAAEFDRFLSATQALTPDALAAAKAQRDLAARTAEAERQERVLVAARESQWRITESLNDATLRGLVAERELLDLRKRAAFSLGKPGEAPDFTDFRAEIDARRARGDKSDRIVRQEDADRIQDAAVGFATTVLDAGKGFVGVIESFQSGNIGAGIGGIGSTVGSLLGGFGLGPAGSIVTGVFGLVASLVGLGSNRSREEEERRRAADLRRSQVSTLEFNFTFNQSNTFTGDLTSSANQSKLREAGIMSFRDFEQFLKRSLLPRIENLEARTAVL